MNAIPESVGFPRMMKETGEKRVFLPEFIQGLAQHGLRIYLEEGYGSHLGYTFADYHQGNDAIDSCAREQVFQQDLILVLRSPRLEEYAMVKKGAILFSMLHFPTRPKRVGKLQELGIRAISMDSVANDNDIRLIENMHAVAWNGLEAAFDVLERKFTGLMREKPFNVLILGSGMVGKHAVDSATKLGNIERNNQHIHSGGPGSLALTIGRNLSKNANVLQQLFQNADVLVDATQRRDASQVVVPNEWLGWLPEHAVIVDLAVDPYTLDIDPPVVRGVEGIPQGNLDKYVFAPDDPDWDASVPASIPSSNRRTVVSCYSWPGIHPEACMRHYAQQMEPLLDVLLEKGYDSLSLGGGYFERALYRATLQGWQKTGHRSMDYRREYEESHKDKRMPNQPEGRK
jgi:alanine dehydrogenase